MSPEFSDVQLSVEAFRVLRAAAGLSVFSAQATEMALNHTLHGAWLYDGNVLVGMGRVIGDQGCFAQITDVAVYPRLQRQAWGTRS